MTDDRIHDRITQLVDEEHALRAADHHTIEDKKRLQELEVQLDQAWDLLRQRDALRYAGRPPGEATTRPADEVKGYLQ